MCGCLDDLSEKRLKELWDSHVKKTNQLFDDSIVQQESEGTGLEEKDAERVDNAEARGGTGAQEEAVAGDEGEAEPARDVAEQQPTPLQSELSLCAEEVDDSYAEFHKDPFVHAAAMFRQKQYHGILEVLTEAVEKGKGFFRCEIFCAYFKGINL